MELLYPSIRPRGAVLVIHSWWGLTHSFRHYGVSLAEAGYLVGLADLFDGSTATTQDEARALRGRKRSLPMYRALGADIDGLRAYAGEATLRIGVVGFSMGGHWAVWLSQRSSYGIAATVLYYAARGGDFSDSETAIVAHFADKDPWVSEGARRSMERAIHRVGCTYQAFDYPSTSHWFAEDGQPSFDAHAARVALGRDLRHLERYVAF